MKKEVLDRCENSSSLCKLDFHLEQNHLKHPDLGFGADTVIKDKLKRDETTKADVKLFKDSCRVSLNVVTCKFVEKSPLQYAVVRNATCLVPESICNHETPAKESLKGLVSNLFQTKWITPRNGDEINSEYKRYIEKVAAGNRESFLRFSKLKDRLDEFYFFSVGGLDEYLQLYKVIKMVLTLFHGQASVKRGFNINKAMLQPNLMSKSLTSQRLVYDHMKAHNSSAESVVITKQLRDSVKRAQKQQRIDLAERKKQESDNARKHKQDAIVTDIKELEAKKIALEKVEKKLKTDSELLLIKAAEDAKNAHTYAIEGKIIMEEHKKKPTEINKLEDNKVFTRKVQGAVVNIFF